MPRTARIKSCESIYHVMVRSVGDTILFKEDNDKDVFMKYIKKYMDIFLFKVYAYCIMDTHAHLLIDSNGADISKFMHCINQCYAQFYNRKYKRHGHVFADRFKSKIVDDERYLFTVSGYIHNNPSDIPGYQDRVHKYNYSSFKIYLGIGENKYNIVDESFIMIHFGKNISRSRAVYYKFVSKCKDPETLEYIEFEGQATEYRSERKIILRNCDPNEIIKFVATYAGEDYSQVHIRNKRRVKDFRAVSILVMRSLCGLSYKEICGIIGNITQSRASSLSSEGLRLIKDNIKYKGVIESIIGNFKRCV